MVIQKANDMCRKTMKWIFVWWHEKDCKCNEGDSARDESTEEQLQCQKAVYMHS